MAYGFEEEYWKGRKFEDKYHFIATQYAETLQPIKVLDYGCGRGFLVHAFNYLGINCVGFDISEWAVKHPWGLAKDRISGSIKDKDYDLVVCFDVLEHVSPVHKEGEIIDALCYLSNKYILLSICDTKLSKTYIDETHINIKPRAYWEYQFIKRGWKKMEIPKDWMFKDQLYLFTKDYKPFDGSYAYESLMDNIISEESDQARLLGNFLMKILKPKSVIDCGCGPGIYLKSFKDGGCEVLGIDYCKSASKYLSEFEQVDLRFPYEPKKKYDLSICLEVAEHIDKSYAGILIDNLVKTSDTILFSAATPKQGGENHINEQKLSYWINLFKTHGYELHRFNNLLKNYLNNIPCNDWLRNNTVLLRKIK